MAENKPTNKELWERAKAAARQKFDVYPSAYANAWAVKWYKDKGGGWKKMAEGGLTEWFDEKWVDLGRPKEGGGYEECGRSDADKGEYPKCVPAAKAAKMTESEKRSAVKRKRAAESDGKGGKPTNVSTFVKKLAGGGMVADQTTMAPLLKEQYSDEEIVEMAEGGITLESLKKMFADAAAEQSRKEGGKIQTYKVGNTTYAVSRGKSSEQEKKEKDWDAFQKEAEMDEAIQKFQKKHNYKPPADGILRGEDFDKLKNFASGGYVVTRSSERKGKTHKVTGPDGSVKFFGDPNLKNRPDNPDAKKSWYARHAKSLKENPHFRAYARATWAEGGIIPAGFETMVEGDFTDPNMPTAQFFQEGGRPEELEELDAATPTPAEEAAGASLPPDEREARQTMGDMVRQVAEENAARRAAELPEVPPNLGAFIKPIREAQTIEEYREVLDRAKPAFDIADARTKEQFAGLMRNKFAEFSSPAPAPIAKTARRGGDDMAGGLTEFDRVEETATVVPQRVEGKVEQPAAPKEQEKKSIPLEKAGQYETLKDDRKEAIYRSALSMGASDQEAKAIAVDIVGERTAGSTALPTAEERQTLETEAEQEAAKTFESLRTAAPAPKPAETPAPAAVAPAPPAKATETPPAATKPAEAAPTPTPAPAPAVEAAKPVPAPPVAPPPAAPVAPLAPADKRALELKDITDRGLGGQYQIVKTAAMRIGGQDDATAHETAYATITGKTYAGTTPVDAAAAEERAKQSAEFQDLQKIKAAQLAAAQEILATDIAARKIKEKVAAAQEELLLREREKFEAQRRALQMQTAALRKQVLEDGVNPDRYLADPRNNIKTASVIGILGRFLGSKTSVQDYIQKKISDDIDLQQKEMTRRRTVLGDLIQQGNSLDDSFKLTEAFYKQLFALQIEREAGGLKDRKARADALKLAADISLEASKQQETIIKNRIGEEFQRLRKGISGAGTKALDTFEGLRLLLQDEGMQRAGARAGRAASLREEELGLKKTKEFGTPLEQQARGGASITGKQLGQLPRDTQKLAVPVYTFSENPESEGMIKGKDKFVLAQGEPKDAEAIRESDREAMQFLGTLKKLRDIAKKYNYSGFVSGVGPLSTDQRKADEAAAEGYQRDIIAFLARKTFYNTGTPQEGEYKRLQESAPDAAKFKSGAFGKSQFDRFYQMAVMAAKSAREARLRSGLEGSGRAADLGGEAP